MKIGDIVQVEHVIGKIVGKDLPESDCWRWVIEILKPKNAKHERIVNLYKNKILCFDRKEVSTYKGNKNGYIQRNQRTIKQL